MAAETEERCSLSEISELESLLRETTTPRIVEVPVTVTIIKDLSAEKME